MRNATRSLLLTMPFDLSISGRPARSLYGVMGGQPPRHHLPAAVLSLRMTEKSIPCLLSVDPSAGIAKDEMNVESIGRQISMSWMTHFFEK